MKTMAVIPRILIAVAAIVLVILLVNRPTRITVLRSMAVLDTRYAHLLSQNISPRDIEASAQITDAHRQDVDIQIAEQMYYAAPASTQVGNDRVVTPAMQAMDRLQQLTSAFPHSPALYAAILRVGSTFAANAEGPQGDTHRNGNPEALTRIPVLLGDAERGELLDPNNSFFPWMSAVLLFDLHRSDEAMRQISASRTESGWDDYMNEELKGKTVITDGWPEVHDSLTTLNTDGMSLFTPYGPIRLAARSALNLADHLQDKGYTKASITIRQMVMREGSSMRRHSPMIAGATTGEAIEDAAYSGIGNPPIAVKPEAASTINRTADSRQADLTYLRGHGYVDEATWAVTEYANAATIQSAVQKSFTSSGGVDAGVYRSSVWMLAAVVALANALWLLLIGFAIAGTAGIYQRMGQKQRPLLCIPVIAVAAILFFILYKQAAAAVVPIEIVQGLGATIHHGAVVIDARNRFVLAAQSALLYTAVPLLLFVAYFIRAFLIKQRLPDMIAYALPPAFATAAAVMILLFAAIVLPASRREQLAMSDVQQSIQSEIGFYIKASGTKVPFELPAPRMETPAS